MTETQEECAMQQSAKAAEVAEWEVEPTDVPASWNKRVAVGSRYICSLGILFQSHLLNSSI